ncbi:MAG: gliding motility-associated C-terminal domain-containing protein, partial [Bacteroidia bacterium]|nr:gliding motility-associated C-terminal domain-containing protein [Bacteroidia bacterium]
AQFPGNTVEVYNRWGQKLAGIKDYDNENNVWRGTVGASTQMAPAATYFYIIDLGNGAAPLKGWLELTTNR